MKFYASTFFILLLSILGCSSSKTTADQAPIEFGDIYYQEVIDSSTHEVSAIKLYIPIKSNPQNIALNNVHYKGQISKLKFDGNIYTGVFPVLTSSKPDIIMSSDTLAEYGNEIPKILPKSKFVLNENECMVSYVYKKQERYHELTNIQEKNSM